VNVDLDDSSATMLLRSWFNIPRLYPGAHVNVYVSPSGVGWHVRTDRKVNNFEYLVSQALLWADPVRTQYLIRKMVQNPEENHLDLMFTEKQGKAETPVPLREILAKYEKEVSEINQNLDREDHEAADKQVRELAKKIEPDLDKYHKGNFVGCIAFNGADLKENVVKVLMDIADKHPEFKWRLYPVWFPEYEYLVAIFSDSKDNAWKKLVWVKQNLYKTDEKGAKVFLLKEANTRMFVKERKNT